MSEVQEPESVVDKPEEQCVMEPKVVEEVNT